MSDNPQQAVGYPRCRGTLLRARSRHKARANPPQAVGHPAHIKACQPDGMYLTARATWFVATDSLTTAKYEHVLGHNGYCSAFYISLVVAVRPQAIPDRVGGSAVHGAPFDKLRANVVHTLPLITRPTEHSGVTFGAATSVLLTGVGNVFAVRRYKNGAG